MELLWSAVEAGPRTPVTVDLLQRQVRAAGRSYAFDLQDSARHRLLHGLDDIAVTVGHVRDIDAYEASRPSWLPLTTG